MTRHLRYYHRKARVHKATGRTAHGTAPRRRFLTPEERRFANIEKFRRRTAAMHKMGLTTRGTAPKRKNLTAREREWREFKLSISK